ncbi:MAG: DUF3127 domain-containing protein [Porphyromonas sp.]|nr:DUF3127 domain-containing protein [Porphyromonas sp.]
MNNYLTGKITHVLEPVSGESKRTPGTTWKKQDYVMETNDIYPRTVAFNIFGEDRINMANIQLGEVITIEFEVNSREYNGRWYTDVQCRNVIRGEQAQAISQVGVHPQPAPAPQTQTQVNFGPAPQQQGVINDPTDDLPF